MRIIVALFLVVLAGLARASDWTQADIAEFDAHCRTTPGIDPDQVPSFCQCMTAMSKIPHADLMAVVRATGGNWKQIYAGTPNASVAEHERGTIQVIAQLFKACVLASAKR
jgi:hypothetical protein